ncbi:MAG: phosphatidylglycerol lysyltransferase domain-containing protein [Nanoarchaeota archaeon]
MTLQELSIEDAITFSAALRRRTFVANPFYLLYNCLWERQNGEVLLYEKERIDGEHPLLFLPRSPANFTNKIVSAGFDEDVPVIQKTHRLRSKEHSGFDEFVYSTDEWIALEGAPFKDIRKRIHGFQREHQVRIVDEYPKEHVLRFLHQWAAEKRTKEVSEATRGFFEVELEESAKNLDLIGRILHKKIFIEVDGALAGFSIFFPLVDDLWVALMQKTTHGIRGLPQFLYHLKAKEMGDKKFFTTGAAAQDPDLRKFKESLRPVEIKPIYVLRVGEAL